MIYILASIAALATLTALILAACLVVVQMSNSRVQKESHKQNALIRAAAKTLRTSLQNVVGLSRIAASQAALDSEESRFLLAKISRAGGEMGVVLDDTLDIFDLAAGKLVIQQGAFNLSGLIAGIRESYSPVAEKKGLTLGCASIASPNVWIEGDEARLRKCIAALVEQLIKHSKGGDIKVAAALVKAKSPEELELRIRAGSGDGDVDRRMLKSFFDPSGYRGDADVARDSAGMLSLVLVKKLAEKMGGELKAKTNDGEGVTFLLTLKTKEVAAPSAAPVDPTAAAQTIDAEPGLLTGKTVLAVDDDETNLVVLSGFLEELDAERILSARNGEEALQVLAENECDLIFMDIYMPVVDGLTAAESIRRLAAPKGNTPIIALTAVANLSERQRCLDAGMDFFISKPLRMDALRMAIMLVFRKGKGDEASAA